MKDEIFYGNLLGLLKRGRWSLSVEESQALLAITKEVEARLAPKPRPVPMPISNQKTSVKKEKVKK